MAGNRSFALIVPISHSAANGAKDLNLFPDGLRHRHFLTMEVSGLSDLTVSQNARNLSGGDFTAERRMFAKTIIDSDAFLDMSMSTQCLYFHLAMRADDDGFINNPKKIQRMIGASDDDLKMLIWKNFLIEFDNGVVVIKHWRIHNYIRNDRYKPTVYKEEKALLKEKENGAYTFGIPNGNQMDTKCIPDGNQMDTQVRLELELGKSRLEEGKDNKTLSDDSVREKRKRFVPPTVEEVQAYCDENKYNIDPVHFVDYYTANGWMAGKNKMKDWKAAVRNWVNRDKKPEKKPEHSFTPTVF